MTLPPWGILTDFTLGTITQSPVPPDWLAHGYDAGRWATFRDDVIDGIAALLWPKYVNGQWQGAAVAGVDALNAADFQLLAALRAKLNQNVSPTPTLTQGELFEFEDTDDPFGRQFDQYDPNAPAVLLKLLPDLLDEGIYSRCGSYHRQLKRVLQRPRAYQVALILGGDPFAGAFAWRQAKSSLTPSMVSGHCTQSALGGCHAFLDFRRRGANNVTIEALQQLTVDIGDRRVFAGVHYPSDNLGAWYAALQIVPYVFDNVDVPMVRKFLWGAISTKSSVYDAIVRYRPAVGESPYALMLQQVRVLGET